MLFLYLRFTRLVAYIPQAKDLWVLRSLLYKNITQRIKKALELFDMSLLDHLIVTDSSYKSFADDNEL